MNNSDLENILKQTCQNSLTPGSSAIVVAHDAVIVQAVTGVRRLGSSEDEGSFEPAVVGDFKQIIANYTP